MSYYEIQCSVYAFLAESAYALVLRRVVRGMELLYALEASFGL